MIFGSKYDRLATKGEVYITINGNVIPLTDLAENFGVYIDSHMGCKNLQNA